ncbi:MAG: hypothetical protein J7K02_07765 [Deltaproteobacteria bacterium]|nr:hypothetical protein [Deltaproteobacteria bacterium]
MLKTPHKSGHQPTSRIIVKSTLHVRADLWGHADAPYLLRAWSKKRHTYMLLKCSIFKMLPQLIEKLPLEASSIQKG